MKLDQRHPPCLTDCSYEKEPPQGGFALFVAAVLTATATLGKQTARGQYPRASMVTNAKNRLA